MKKNKILIVSEVLLAFLAVPSITWIILFLRDNGHSVDWEPLLAKVLMSSSSSESTTNDLPSFVPEPFKKYKIAACAKISNTEIPYLLEWIEFHRLQGVDKFLFAPEELPGDPESISLQLSATQQLYPEKDLIEIVPNLLILGDAAFAKGTKNLTTNPRHLHRLSQHHLMTFCVERFKKVADWILHIDIDEFLYATDPNSNLWQYINADYKGKLKFRLDPRRMIGFYFYLVNFGMDKSISEFHTQIMPDPFTGKIRVYFDPRDHASLAPGPVKTWDELLELELKLKKDPDENVLKAWFADYYAQKYNISLATVESEFWLKQMPENCTDRFCQSRKLREFWLQFYPMVTDSQLKTRPHGQYIDPNISSIFEDPNSEPATILKEDPNKLGFPLTLLGKSIWKTEAMERSTYDRANNRLRGCLRPWVHYCTWSPNSGKLFTVLPTDGVRLDHHQFRSWEKRTLGMPLWRGRGTGVGFITNEDFTKWQQWLSQSEDDYSKSHLAKKVKKRLGDLFDLVASPIVDGKWISKCSLVDILEERQAPCPEKNPYVGYGPVDRQTPNSFLPYHWCNPTPIELNNSQNWYTPPMYLNATNCPGFPELQCCDYMVLPKGFEITSKYYTPVNLNVYL